MYTDTLGNILRQTGGKLMFGSERLPVRELFTDTRKPVAGALFAALRGENFNGNTYAIAALTHHKAAAALMDDPVLAAQVAASGLPHGCGVILVKDTRDALLEIAAARRKWMTNARWFGVTGSVGKSSTKEMLAHILQECNMTPVHKAQGSFNNAIGLSQTIISAPEDSHTVVLEIGTNHPGEIAQLTATARPQIAIITRAAESHMEAFHTVENVAIEKGAILDYQQSEDVAILNADDPHFEMWKARAKGSVVSFGRYPGAQMLAENLRANSTGCAQFTACWQGMKYEITLRISGIHQAVNTLAAIAAAVSSGVSFADACAAAGRFEGVARRFAVSTSNGVTIVDDAYNANPASFKAALETLNTIECGDGGRRFVVAGDMLELGDEAPRWHQELGVSVAWSRASVFATVGNLAALAGESAVEHGLPNDGWLRCNTPEQAAESLSPLLRGGDVVLVKGSHGMNLDRCCRKLKELLTRAG